MQFHFSSLKNDMEILDHDFAHQEYLSTKWKTSIYSAQNLSDLTDDL
jgi:hypothetical protein